MNTRYTALSLANSGCADIGAKATASMLMTNPALTSLDFTNNQLTGAGFKAIAGALKVNSSLTSLDLKVAIDENVIFQQARLCHHGFSI